MHGVHTRIYLTPRPVATSLCNRIRGCVYQTYGVVGDEHGMREVARYPGEQRRRLVAAHVDKHTLCDEKGGQADVQARFVDHLCLEDVQFAQVAAHQVVVAGVQVRRVHLHVVICTATTKPSGTLVTTATRPQVGSQTNQMTNKF